jgi:hypothetical protein
MPDIFCSICEDTGPGEGGVCDVCSALEDDESFCEFCGEQLLTPDSSCDYCGVDGDE